MHLDQNAQVTSIQVQKQAVQQLEEEEVYLMAKENAQIKREWTDKLEKEETKQKIETFLQKVFQEKVEHIWQKYRKEQDLNMNFVQGPFKTYRKRLI